MSQLEDVYRDLHAHPELAFEEHRTAGIAGERMRALGLETTEGVGGTGVVAVLENGAGPTIWLRADMDGLPVQEETGLGYASVVEGVMHACGHDMHVTWLIGAMERLLETRAEWSGRVRRGRRRRASGAGHPEQSLALLRARSSADDRSRGGRPRHCDEDVPHGVSPPTARGTCPLPSP